MNKIEQALAQMRKEAAESAERKLGRKLSDAELAGLDAISSPMRLESICTHYASEQSSAESVADDLHYFATKAANSN